MEIKKKKVVFWQLYNSLLEMCSLKCNRDILMLTLLYY